MIYKECFKCKRYFSGSCNGVEDRKRKKITIENSCSGYLKIGSKKQISKEPLCVNLLQENMKKK